MARRRDPPAATAGGSIALPTGLARSNGLVVVARGLAANAEPFENAHHLLVRHRRAEHPGEARGAQRDRLAPRQSRLVHGLDDRSRTAAGDLYQLRRGHLERLALSGRVDTAFEAVRGLGVAAVAAWLADQPRRKEQRALEKDVRGVLVDRRRQPAHHARDGDRAGLVGDDGGLGVELDLAPVEERQRLARCREAHVDAARELVEVEGVHRLTALEHDVVGHVDPRADRAHARTAQAFDDLRRHGGAHVDVSHHAAGEPRTGGVLVDGHRERVVELGRERCHRVLDERQVVLRREIAGETTYRQAVGPVGCQVDLDDRVVEPEPGAEFGAGRGVAGEFHDAAPLLGESELGRRAQHAVRLDAAQLRLLEPGAVGQPPADPCEGGRETLARVRRTADDLQRLLLAGLDRADAQPVRVGVLPGRDDPPDHDVLERGACRLDAVLLEPERGELLGEGAGVEGRIYPLAKPSLADLHAPAPLVWKCSRKRRSFSKKRRRSSTP